MSKEQTPIESLIIDLKIMAKIPDNYTLPMIIEMIENEYLPKEQQYTQAKVLEALEREQEDLDFIYSLLPKWTKEVPKGHGGMFYGTLSYEGDLKVKERVDKILHRNRSKTKV